MYDIKPHLDKIDRVIERGPFKPTWESLAQYRVPQWYCDAKFGIFIHWGVYSVPAFDSEWYPRNMYIEGSAAYEHHLKTYGPHKDFGYKDFIPMFRAESFDPEAWAALFADIGAQYVVPVAEHHDGFQMYDSELSHFNAAQMGPKRNVLGELAESCRKRGLSVGASTHRIEHWFFLGNGRKFDSDIREPLQRGDLYWPSMPDPENLWTLQAEPAPSKEFLDDWMVRTCELIDNYRPKLLYFDWWIQQLSAKAHLKKIAAYYYNRALEWGEGVVINYKHEAFLLGTAVPDIERGQSSQTKPYIWQTDTAVALNSWCYTDNNQFRSAGELLCDLVDIISKNGRLLLNIGPKADGSISEEERAVLMDIGAWMRVNREAVYGCQVWEKFGEGPTEVKEGHFTDKIKKHFTCHDFRFTVSGEYLYAFAMKPSEDGHYCIRSLAVRTDDTPEGYGGMLCDISVLGAETAPRWERTAEGLFLHTDYRAAGPLVFKMRRL